MRRFLVLPAILVLVLTSVAFARPQVSSAQVERVSAPEQLRSLVIIKSYGAALRFQPDSDAGIAYVASCGDVFPVVDSYGGWYQVYSYAYDDYLWVGGARVANAANPPYFSCRDAVTYQMGDEVASYVRSGCLSVRYYPSRQAPYDSCVYNGHLFTLTNGPIEVDGEDWFEAWSPDTGYGWVLANYLRYVYY